MSFLQSLHISGSGLTAQKLRMDIISENIANMDSTRTADGGAYRRKLVAFQANEGQNFKDLLEGATNSTEVKGGVEVSAIIEDQTPFKLEYNPEHPDANAEGYVELPNVDSLKETVDMMDAYRAYQANITALNTIKQMAMGSLEIGK